MLDSRLGLVASFVRRGSRLLDIGTDHAYVPAMLLKNGICSFATCSDINKGPLESAIANLEKHGVSKNASCILSNGFENVPENCADDIVIAGMGGILISEILSRCEWIKNGSVRLILRPMTHAEKLREYLIKNGFKIETEKACSDSKHNYCVIVCSYDGKIIPYEKGYAFYGELKNDDSSEAKAFLEKQKAALKKRLCGLNSAKKSQTEDNTTSEEIAFLEEIINEMDSFLC